MNRTENRKENRLDFVGIGAQKSATTWLFQCLKEHPQVETAGVEENKELDFFNYNYFKGYHWYHSLFEFKKECIGEYSVLYLYDKNVPYRLFQYNPQIKIIVSLRHPVRRAYSQHLHEIKEGNIPKELYCFSNALKYNPSYLDMGRYASELERFFQYFDRDQFYIVLFDEIEKNSKKVLEKLFAFLGLDKNFLPPSAMKVIYKSHLYRSYQLHKAINMSAFILQKSLGGIYPLLKRTGLSALLRRYNKQPVIDTIVPPLTTDEYRSLLDYYEEEIDQLEELIGRDLTNWKD